MTTIGLPTFWARAGQEILLWQDEEAQEDFEDLGFVVLGLGFRVAVGKQWVYGVWCLNPKLRVQHSWFRVSPRRTQGRGREVGGLCDGTMRGILCIFSWVGWGYWDGYTRYSTCCSCFKVFASGG